MAALPAEIAPKLTHHSLVEKFANRYSVEPSKLLSTLKATAFKVDSGEVSNEQMAALLIVADQYKLNPFTKEIFAFPDSKKGIVPILSIDGWARIINERAELDGIEFIDGPAASEGAPPEWIECVIYRKDRAHPIRVRERMKECKRGTGPWGSHPSRMLRHKALIQCARVAFGFAGIYDQDEAEQIIERDVTPPAPQAADADTKTTRTATVTAKVKAQRQAAPVDVQEEPPQQTEAHEPARAPEPITDEALALLEMDAATDEGVAAGVLDLCKGQPFYTRMVDSFNKRFSQTIG